MPEVFKRIIIKLLKHVDYAPLKLGELSKALSVSSEDYQRFKSAFDELCKSGQVVVDKGKFITLPPLSGRIVGTFRANPKGFGFVIPLEPNSHGDLFIPPSETAGAMTGDVVAAKVVKKSRYGKKIGKRPGRSTSELRYGGRIIEIIERGRNRFVGTLLKKSGGWIVQPDGTLFSKPITVDDVGAKGAKQKDKVVVEILSYPTVEFVARGVIVEVLGKAGRYDSEIKSIVCQHHLPGEFEADCIEQGQRAAAEFNPENAMGREDITEKLLITIDPPDAKDFDDAISLEKDGDGNWVLGVHIADVSSFVLPDSPLDTEANDRGNSVYLPGKTIPMLPEILSNGICSLQPGQQRLTKTAYLTYDQQGKVLSRRFANSVICSKQRLTYTEADKILKGRTKGVSPEVVELLKNTETLSRIIGERRRKNGMLHLDLPETELVLDKSGRVVDAKPADDSYPHTIIEMFMVEANDAVASVLDKFNIDFMRRIHPEPDVLSMRNLAKLIKTFGFGMPREPNRKSMQDLLAAVKGTDYSLAVNLVVLRSFEKAQYAPLNIGHFALASAHYCHFTSPIRRYADLLIHRVLECYLKEGKASAKHFAAGQGLAEIGKHITFTEQRAEDAERELKRVLILQMLSKRIGEELDGIVTGVTGFGVFVQSRKFGIEGLILLADLGPDQWKYNQRTHCVVGQSSGYSIHLGLAMKVRIVSVNVPARQLNVSPAEPLVSVKKIKKKRKAVKERRKKEGLGQKENKRA